MPLATEIRESLKGAMLVQKVGAIRQISTTLGAMARLDPPIRHRDVKQIRSESTSTVSR